MVDIKNLFVALTGPSGIGKTTVQKCLLNRNFGLDVPFYVPLKITTRPSAHGHDPFERIALSKNEFNFYVENNLLLTSYNRHGYDYGIIDPWKTSSPPKPGGVLIQNIPAQVAIDLRKRDNNNLTVCLLRFTASETTIYNRLIARGGFLSEKDRLSRMESVKHSVAPEEVDCYIDAERDPGAIAKSVAAFVLSHPMRATHSLESAFNGEEELSERNLFLALTGPSGVGKSTLQHFLLELGSETRISFTVPQKIMTRQLRPSDDPEERSVLEPEEFEDYVRENNMLVLYDRNNHRYGIVDPWNGKSPPSSDIVVMQTMPFQGAVELKNKASGRFDVRVLRLVANENTVRSRLISRKDTVSETELATRVASAMASYPDEQIDLKVNAELPPSEMANDIIRYIQSNLNLDHAFPA